MPRFDRAPAGRVSRRPARIASALAALLPLSLLVLACSPSADPMQPPPFELFVWGEPAEVTGDRLQARGWTQPDARPREGGVITYELAAAEPEELPGDLNPGAQGFELDSETVLPRYSVRLFAPDGVLRIVHVLRRDDEDALRSFRQSVLDAYGLETPVWEAGPRERVSEAGNRTAERITLFAGPQAFYVLQSTLFAASEADMARNPNSVLELRLYSRNHNEGLSGDALQASLEAEFAALAE